MKNKRSFATSALTIFFLSALILPASAFAAKPTCKDCDQLKALTEKASKLDPKNIEDRIKGVNLIMEAQPLFISLDEMKDKSKISTEIFKAAVEFSREAVLFDDESQLAEFLGDWTHSNKKIKEQFEVISKAFSVKPQLNTCKNQRLISGVEEAACLAKAKVGPEDKGINSALRATQKCLKPFDLEACLKKTN